MITLHSGFDPATYNVATSTGFTVGGLYSASNGKLYRFINVVTAAGADGVVFVRSGSSEGVVIGCNRGGVAGTVYCVGVGVITINNFGFGLVLGTHTNVLSTSSNAGRWQTASGTNDTCTDASASIARTEGLLGMALTTTSGGRCTVDVRCL